MWRHDHEVEVETVPAARVADLKVRHDDVTLSEFLAKMPYETLLAFGDVPFAPGWKN
jgi:hypothetical protein